MAPGAGSRDAFEANDDVWLPLYEAKLIHQFDHRFATYERDGSTRDVTEAEHKDPEYLPVPRYWVRASEVESTNGIGSDQQDNWFLGFRDIARATDVRTSIFSLLPRCGVGNKLPLWFVNQDVRVIAALFAGTTTFVFDFSTRQKLGGTSMNFFIVKQLPVLPPETYTTALLDLIVPRVLELTYTAWDLRPFALDCGFDGPPFAWDEERRLELRSELDGIYAHLYGISRDDFSYILDTFPIVQRNDEKLFGEYRTKRLCLEAFDWFAGPDLERRQ